MTNTSKMRRMNDINYALDAYDGELARAGRTPATRLKYRQILWLFAAYLDDNGIRDCDLVAPEHCRRFLDRWVNASASTLALHVSILRGFFAFLEDETVIETSPMARIKRPRRKRPEDVDVVSVTTAELNRILDGCANWQEILCCYVLAYSGLRRTAASNLRRRDVDLDRGIMKVREKGGKVDRKPIADQLTAIIRAADEQHVWASGEDYLIPNRRQHRNRERSAKVIYDTVKKVAQRVGVRTHVHALRAAFAVEFDDQNPDRLIALKELLGHSRIETTMVYLRRKDRAREMETVRGFTLGGSVFPPNAGVPPAGFEPALRANPEPDPHSAEALPSTLPAALRQKLDELRDRREVEADRP